MSEVSSSQLLNTSILSPDNTNDKPQVQSGDGVTGSVNGSSVGKSLSNESGQNDNIAGIMSNSNTVGVGENIDEELSNLANNGNFNNTGDSIINSMIGTQTNLSPENQQQILSDFAEILQNNDDEHLSLDMLPRDIINVNPQIMTNFVQDNTVTEVLGPTEPQINTEDPPLYKEMKEDLERYKNEYGGSPNYPNGKPSYNPQVKTFFGRDYHTMYEYWDEKIKTAPAIFKPFCYLMRWIFDENSVPQTQFESKYLNITSMALMAANKDLILAALEEDEQIENQQKKLCASCKGSELLVYKCHLTPHPDHNGGAKGVRAMVITQLQNFEYAYNKAKSTGKLKEFFDQAVAGACMPDRGRKIQNFISNVLTDAEEKKAFEVLPSTMEFALNRLTEKFPKVNDLTDNVYPKWSEAKAELLSVMNGKEFEKTDEFGQTLSPKQYIVVNEENIESLKAIFENVMAWEFAPE